MKIFISSKSAYSLGDSVIERFASIKNKSYTVLIGDDDELIQSYFVGYKNVVVYAANGKAKNNVGGWEVKAVEAMVNDCDCGYVLLVNENAVSKGNIDKVIRQGKVCVVHEYSKGVWRNPIRRRLKSCEV